MLCVFETEAIAFSLELFAGASPVGQEWLATACVGLTSPVGVKVTVLATAVTGVSPRWQERPATLCVVEAEILRLAIAVRRCLPPLGGNDIGYAVCDWIWATMAPLPPLGWERPSLAIAVTAVFPRWGRSDRLRHERLELSYSGPLPPQGWKWPPRL